MFSASFVQVPPFLHGSARSVHRSGKTVVVVVVAIKTFEVSSHRLPVNPVGQVQVARILQVPPFWQPAVKQFLPISNWHELPPNPVTQIHSKIVTPFKIVEEQSPLSVQLLHTVALQVGPVNPAGQLVH